uniref:Uncharacterized protein n=1 Tax=Trichogramma kaykai TaxID=54128 RepID=A0ABD2XMC3_9HYME
MYDISVLKITLRILFEFPSEKLHQSIQVDLCTVLAPHVHIYTKQLHVLLSVLSMHAHSYAFCDFSFCSLPLAPS